MVIITPHTVYRCRFSGCNQVYKSHSNMTRHFKTHFRAASTQTPLTASDERMSARILEQPCAARPSAHNMGSRRSIRHLDHGTPGLGAIRFSAPMRLQIQSIARLTGVKHEISLNRLDSMTVVCSLVVIACLFIPPWCFADTVYSTIDLYTFLYHG